MALQRTAAAFVTLTLAALALAGCVSPAPVPPPPTEDEIAAMREAQAQQWWDSISTGTTMPDIAVIERLPSEEAFVRQSECLEAAQLPGVTVHEPGYWSWEGTPSDPEAIQPQVQMWVCTQQYPAEDDYDWMLSTAQLEWLYDFYAERHIPCLRSLGIVPVGLPSREDFLYLSNGYPAWLPFPDAMNPAPRSSDWELLAKRCPLPELVHGYGLPGTTTEP